MAINVQKTLRRYEQRKNQKRNWLIHWQTIAYYFATRKADFTVNFTPGQFLNRDLYDATGPKAVRIAASAFIGALWPNGASSFRLKLGKEIPDTKENKDWIDRTYDRLATAMDDPAAALQTTLDEYMRDDVTFGTAAIAVFRGSGNTRLMFRPWDVKRMVIIEGPNGYVTSIYYEREMTVEQVAQEYGLENMSEKARGQYNNNDLDGKCRVLHFIEPRDMRNPTGESVLDMPVISGHIEMDTSHVLRESGYPEMPIFVSRFMKNIQEDYGRSLAMDALPDALELNALREAEIIATEKSLDPALGVLDDGRLGPGTIDTSAGAITVFNASGRIGNQPPVFQLQQLGDFKFLKERIEELKQSVTDHFMIDRLLDLNNETEMTLGEAQIRNKLRGMTLGSLFARQIAEVFSPMIHRCFNVCLMDNVFGVMPGSPEEAEAIANGRTPYVIPADISRALLSGEDAFAIEYLTPAARMMQAELAEGIINTWKFMNDIAQTQPEIYDNVDEDQSVRTLAPLLGAPRIILRDQKSIDQIRAARAKAQQAQQQKTDALEAAKVAGKLMPRGGAPGVNAGAMGMPMATV